MISAVECRCKWCAQVWWMAQGEPRSGFRHCPNCHGVSHQVRDVFLAITPDEDKPDENDSRVG